MKHPKNSCYNLVNSTKKSVKEKQKIGLSILIPFLQIFDTFYYMNKFINVTNKQNVDFWSLEEHYSPIETLFLLCKIEDENHKEILFGLIYENALSRVGDKDFKDRAKEILTHMKQTIASLAAT